MGDRVDRQRHRKIYPTMRRSPVWMPEIETLTVTFVSGEYIKESAATKYFYVNSPIVVMGGTDNMNVFISAITIQGSPTSSNQYKVTVGRSANILAGVISSIDTIGAAVGARTAGTYLNVSAAGGAGSGAKFNIIINGSGAASVITIANAGSGYVVGNTLTVADSSLGTGGAAALTFNVATLQTQEVHLHLSEATT